MRFFVDGVEGVDICTAERVMDGGVRCASFLGFD